MFMHATNLVLEDDRLLSRFNIPPALWPRIHQSWNNRRNQMITGRFDFAVSERGVKLYEYNADSASCQMETGLIQGLWAINFGCTDGWCPGRDLHDDLIEAWRESGVDDILHIMQDHDLEENYHALYMKSAMEKAGIRCKIIHGTSDLQWDKDGGVCDADGIRIKWVWKTWAWETALDQIRDDLAEDETDLRLHRTIDRTTQKPRIVDVLLREEVMVFEPLWTLIPSNKAILPVLWELFPNHPYLLETAFELTDELRASGYVSKPIVGRCGSNIRMFGSDAGLIEATSGQFERQQEVYQELFRLPVVGGFNAQMVTFSAAGKYAGSAVRVGRTPLITGDSDLIALRVVEDRDILADLNAKRRREAGESGYQI